jgi:hypothetical protein
MTALPPRSSFSASRRSGFVNFGDSMSTLPIARRSRALIIALGGKRPAPGVIT